MLAALTLSKTLDSLSCSAKYPIHPNMHRLADHSTAPCMHKTNVLVPAAGQGQAAHLNAIAAEADA